MSYRGLPASRPRVFLLIGASSNPPAADAATPAHVQSRANEIGSGTVNDLAFASPNTAGNLIVVCAP